MGFVICFAGAVRNLAAAHGSRAHQEAEGSDSRLGLLAPLAEQLGEWVERHEVTLPQPAAFANLHQAMGPRRAAQYGRALIVVQHYSARLDSCTQILAPRTRFGPVESCRHIETQWSD